MNPDNPNFRTPEEEARAAELVRLKAEVARQAKVIEKLKGMVSHYETCATVDRYDDEEVPCDCGLEKELEAIEQGEGT